MNYQLSNRAILSLTIPAVLLIILVSLSGILNGKEIYSAETVNWRAQAIAQDFIDLVLLVPCLIISAILSLKKKIKTLIIWAGGMVYTLYTFTIYCYAVNFNSLFPVYCAVLGLSFYSVLLFLISFNAYSIKVTIKKYMFGSGLYLIAVAVVFGLLWLSELLPAVIKGETPEQLIETGLMTNPVHVNDLSVLLPAFFVTGLLLIKRKSAGIIFAPVLLSFSVLMNITIAALVIIMNIYKIESGYAIAYIMLALALISSALLINFFKQMKVGTE